MTSPLVVAYALAGRIDQDMVHEPLGRDRDGAPVYLRDSGPRPTRSRAPLRTACGARCSPRSTPTSSTHALTGHETFDVWGRGGARRPPYRACRDDQPGWRAPRARGRRARRHLSYVLRHLLTGGAPAGSAGVAIGALARSDARVDEAALPSFPASDPPAYLMDCPVAATARRDTINMWSVALATGQTVKGGATGFDGDQ